MSPELFVLFMLLGAVLLAGWTVTRFKNAGPRTLGGALVFAGAAFILIAGLPNFIDGVLYSGVPAAALVMVFGLALPAFTYFFVAAAWFMRVLMSHLDGLR